MITIYTDGSTKGNGRAHSYGGWAYLVEYMKGGNCKVVYTCGAEKNTTNQRMELLAAINGLEYAVTTETFSGDGAEIILFTDSAYLCNCYNEKWYKNWQKNGWKNSKKEPVANKDLWVKLIPYFDKGINIVKVKGHSGNPLNEKVDTLAQAAAEALQTQEEGEC